MKEYKVRLMLENGDTYEVLVNVTAKKYALEVAIETYNSYTDVVAFEGSVDLNGSHKITLKK